jgi:hypothetical protein
MNKIILLFLISVSTLGCNLIPRINFNNPNSVPQSIDQSKTKETCKGEIKFDENGNITSCTKNYYRYTDNYEKKERKMTITEKIKNFINNLVGWGFWGLLLLLILCPSLIGLIIGRLAEGTIGITGKTLRSIIKGVQDARKNGKDLDTALAIELDEENKKYINKIKIEERIK